MKTSEIECDVIEVKKLLVQSPEGGPSLLIQANGKTAGLWMGDEHGNTVGLVHDGVNPPYLLFRQANRNGPALVIGIDRESGMASFQVCTDTARDSDWMRHVKFISTDELVKLDEG